MTEVVAGVYTICCQSTAELRHLRHCTCSLSFTHAQLCVWNECLRMVRLDAKHKDAEMR
jgi:hypothetical protein